jgi:hypothetical protein
MSGSQRPALASDEWMLEQQVRAEMEAEAWRRLRRDLRAVETPAPAPQTVQAPAAEIDHHRAGSAMLKAIVRFMLAAFGAYLAYLAGMDSKLGEFEIWLAVGATFMATLALSMFGAARDFVHMLAETMRWVIITGVGLGVLWLATYQLG